jgi:hypothetical protein
MNSIEVCDSKSRMGQSSMSKGIDVRRIFWVLLEERVTWIESWSCWSKHINFRCSKDGVSDDK